MEKRAVGGEKVPRPSAMFRNDTIDAVEDFKRRRRLGAAAAGERTPRNYAKVKVKNNSGGNLRRGEVLEFTDFLLDDLEPEYLWFDGDTPDLAHVGWGLALRPTPAGEIDDFLCLGVCIAWVNVTSEEHEYATRAAGEVVLQSAETGPVKILYQPTGGSLPEERECVVQIMDEQGEPLRLIKYDWLPAAFGGPNGSYPPTNDNGDRPDDITTKRRLYFRTCNQWHCVNEPAAGPPSALYDGAPEFSTSYLEYNTAASNLLVANPYDLPLNAGWAWCQKVGDNNRYLAVLPMCVNPWGTKHYQWLNDSVNDGTMALQHDQRKLFSQADCFAVDGSGSQGNGDWLIKSGGDLFLPFPGNYQITFGATVGLGKSANSVGYTQYRNVATSTASSHTHDYKEYSAPHLTLKVVANHEPGTTIGGTSFGNVTLDANTLGLPLYPGNYNGAGTSSVMSGEKTFTIFNDANHYHGQSYVRLSLAAHVYFDTSAEGYDYDTTFAQVYRAWMSITPLPRNPGVFGGGAQQWPEGYQWPAGGTFSWYGGGDAPPVLGPDGNEV